MISSAADGGGLLPGHRRRGSRGGHLARRAPVTWPSLRCEVLGYGEADHQHLDGHRCCGPARAGRPGGRADAFARAGLGPADVDVAQVYDSFTITRRWAWRRWGSAPRARRLDFIADGRIRPGGALPLNTSGGGLSYCHPGQFGVLLLVEAVRQLRGECGDRQVPGAEHRRSPTAPAASSPPTPPSSWGWTGDAGATGGPRRGAPADEVTAPWWEATPSTACCSSAAGPAGTSSTRPGRCAPAAAGPTLLAGRTPAAGRPSTPSPSSTGRRARTSRLPYTVARVRLAEGPVLLTRLEATGAVRTACAAIGDRSSSPGATCPTAGPCPSSPTTEESDGFEPQRRAAPVPRHCCASSSTARSGRSRASGSRPAATRPRSSTAMREHGPVRPHRARGVRRAGPRHGLLRPGLRGDRPRLDGHRRHPRQPLAGLPDDRRCTAPRSRSRPTCPTWPRGRGAPASR